MSSRTLRSSAAHAPAPVSSSSPSSSSASASASASASPHSRYNLTKLLGSGSFGEIYLAQDKANGTNVAIKAESSDIRNPQLRHEYTLYRNHLTGVPGFPDVFNLLKSSAHTYFAMTLLGPTLETLLAKMPDSRFSEKTVAMLAIQLLQRLETFHDRTKHVHRWGLLWPIRLFVVNRLNKIT